MRRAAQGVLIAALTLTPAHATPYAGVVRGTQATFALTAADRRPWQLTVRLVYSPGGTELERYVVLRLTQCDAKHRCTYSRQWQQDLAVTDVSPSADGSDVTATTKVAGKPLTVRYVRTGGIYGGGIFVTTGYVEETDTYDVTGTLTFGPGVCTDRKGTGYEKKLVAVNGSAFSSGPAPPTTLPKGLGCPK